MSVNLSILAGAGWQFFTDDGVPLAGGLLYTYAAGTTTPLATYTSSTGGTANANPIVLNSAGRVANQVWLTTGSSYKFVLQNSVATQIWSQDNISGTNDFTSIYTALAASGGSSLVGYLPAGTGAVATTVQTKLRENVSVKDFGAVGNGSTDDRGAISAAQTAAAGNTLLFPAGTYSIASNLTITANCEFQAGAILAPASGVTVTMTGAIVAGVYKIFAVSALKHVDCTNAKVLAAPVEWWGVVGGDTNAVTGYTAGAFMPFSAANAAINKPLIDEAITYGPYELHFKTPGFYSTTGHFMPGDKPHKFVGLGRNAYNGVVGSGLAFPDATNGGTIASSKKYVFQNAAPNIGQYTLFSNIAVFGYEFATDIPVGILFSTLPASSATVLSWNYEAEYCYFQGYVGWHQMWANMNSFRSCSFIGNAQGFAQTVINTDDGLGNSSTIQKQGFYDCLFSQSQLTDPPTSGFGLYQFRGSGVPTGNGQITDISFYNCDFEFCFQMGNLSAVNQTFNTVHIENMNDAGGTFVVENTDARSLWLQPGVYVGGGLNLSCSLFNLEAQLGSTSGVTTMPEYGGGSAIIKLGYSANQPYISLYAVNASPNGVVTAAAGTVLIRTTGATAGNRVYINQNGGTSWIAIASV